MTRRFGIDTSILVRLLTGEPREEFLDCVAGLIALVEHEGSEIFASNQVIGEAYVAVQHDYQVSKTDARDGLLEVLRSGLLSPLNGRAVFEALEAPGSPGLFDRLIADDYSRAGLEVLTLDRRMAKLAGVARLSVPGSGG